MTPSCAGARTESDSAHWRPSASLQTLRFTADVRRRVRAYFDESDALEVVTPVMSRCGATDPSIEPFDTRVTDADARCWLQTSPEFAMKRLLAAYACDIWQLAPVFRRAEKGHRHNREFQLLEWYRVGAELDTLMQDVSRLLKAVVGEYAPFDQSPVTVRYGVSIRALTARWPEELTVGAIASVFADHDRHFPVGIGAQELDAALDLLFDTLVVPDFAKDRPTFVVDYPPSQASLARLTRDQDGREVAARVELYAGSVELANGFHELVDATEQRQRFEAELAVRKRQGQVTPPLDEAFLAALEAGLPACAGIALGIDRLAMVALGEPELAAVMSFDDERA